MNRARNRIARRSALAAAVGASFGFIGAPAFAQQEAQGAVRVEKIEITGSNIRRLEAEGALPVTTITHAEIERSGATTAAELLDKVTAVNAGGYNVSTIPVHQPSRYHLAVNLGAARALGIAIPEAVRAGPTR